MKYRKITHEFVDKIPESLDEGKIYISIPFATAIHKCFCGCGNEVVTPFSPTDWKITYDGETVSLSPSIGNWGFPCRSHYWIRNNEIEIARKWNQKEIDYVRNAERKEKDEYFRIEPKPQKNLFSKFKSWFQD